MNMKMVAIAMAMGLSVSAQSIETEKHYDVIKDNNLFRPLGWTAPQYKPKYKLVGTKIDEDGTGWAYMSLDGGRAVMSVYRVGTEIDNVKVKEITVRKVVMENGEIYETPATEFLTRTDSRNKRSTNRSSTSVRRNSSSKEGEQTTEKQTSRSSRRGGENLRQRWESFQSASPEERERMIKEFRESRGQRGGGNRRGRGRR